jgi:predicted nucleic acid-binding protein
VKKVILDTNLYIDWMNRGLREELLLGPGYARYLSAIVVLELRAGATTRAAVRAVDALSRAYAGGGRVVAPGASVFDAAGRALRALRGLGAEVRRASFVNDVLLSLSARAIGATVFTRDAKDFEVIRRATAFEFVTVA